MGALPAMAVILACWTALALLLVGLGLLLPLGGGRPRWDGDQLFTRFWIGWLVAIAVLQVWSLAAPVAPWSLPFLAVLAAAGLWRGGAGLPGRLRAAGGRRPGRVAAVLLTALWLSNRALGPPVGDAGLYHLNAVRWLAAYGTVPGLADVVRQIGFHHPSLLWSAALETGPMWGRSSHLAIGLLVLAVAARGVIGLDRALRPGASRPVDLFAALLLPVVVAHGVTVFELRLSSPDPDSAAALTALAAATELVAALTGPDEPSATSHRLAALLLATLAALIKLSLAVFGMGLVAIAALAGWTGVAQPDRRRVLGTWAAVAAAVAAPWVARGVVLSGYPFFPSGLLAAPVAWRLPEADRQLLLRAVVGSLPPVVDQLRAAGEGWLRPWLVWQVTRIPELALLPAALIALGLALLVGSRPGPPRRALWLLVVGLPAVAAWLVSAPHPRHVYGVLWACAAAALAAAGSRDLAQRGGRRRAIVIGALVAATAFPAVHRVAAWSWVGERDRALEALFLGPGADHGFHPTPRMQVGGCVTASGLRVHVPVGDDKLWDAPLPAARACDPGLGLRRPGDLGAGFLLRR